jgi:hypothetical protein
MSSHREDAVGYLNIQFLNSADKRRFLEYWPGDAPTRGMRPTDLFNQVYQDPRGSMSELSEDTAPTPELPGMW